MRARVESACYFPTHCVPVRTDPRARWNREPAITQLGELRNPACTVHHVPILLRVDGWPPLPGDRGRLPLRVLSSPLPARAELHQVEQLARGKSSTGQDHHDNPKWQNDDIKQQYRTANSQARVEAELESGAWCHAALWSRWLSWRDPWELSGHRESLSPVAVVHSPHRRGPD